MSESKALTVVERAAVALGTSEHEKNLIALTTKYSDITKIVNGAGRDQVHAAYMELKNARTAIINAGKTAREDAVAFQKAVIAESDRLAQIVEPEQGRLQKLRDDFDVEREREKQAKAAAEKDRVDGIRNLIDEIKTCPAECVGRSAVEIQGAIDMMEAHEITFEEFAEFAGEAEMAKIAALAKLNDALVAQQAHEAVQERIKAERAELERLRAEAEERERIAAAARAEEERKACEQREAEEARLRAEREAHEAELRKEREAEQAKLAAERAEIARQQAELAAAKAEQERIERERQAAIEAEARAKREAEEAAARAEAARIRAEQDAAIAEQKRREAERFLIDGPGDSEIIEVLAAHYDVGHTFVVDWLAKFNAASFLTPYTEQAA